MITARKKIVNQRWLKIARCQPTSGAEIGAASQTDAEFVTPRGLGFLTSLKTAHACGADCTIWPQHRMDLWMQLPGAKGPCCCMARAREDVPAASAWSLGGGDELGFSERPVVQDEADPRAWLLQFPAAGVLAAAAGQEASFLHAVTCITDPSGLFLFSWTNCRAEACQIFY